ncbi:hypothetical protein BGZ80_011349 [Entomortierella chlamydospora]|uniref:Uncharacterized protein n=1 Tax=Entomortierella chlamydospora TaxID=101097 RepID=A0A9P6SZ35_9FUNG|nr:hypothetical protein BGZ79_001893 [Entomortierella chlamydospora]KAG0013041.1 hypothetical protein BGZ80_011349 [Entomortierella chlamydospora]
MRFNPYSTARQGHKLSQPSPPPVPRKIEYMEVDIPAKIDYMEVDGLERPRLPSSRHTRAQRAQPAHPRTTRQMKMVGPHSIWERCPARWGGLGAHVCRTRVLGGGWAALGKFFTARPWCEPMDVDDD